jgi:uncharacterized protein DUF6438
MVATPEPTVGLLVAALGGLVSLIGIVAVLQARVWIVLWFGLGLALLGVCSFFLLGLFGRGYRAERDRVLLERRNQAALDYIEKLDALRDLKRQRTSAPTAEEITEISLSRKGCLGTCPVYVVELSRDGRASWHGDYFTDRLGDFTGSVIEDQFVLLADLIERSGFFGWNETYQSPGTDLEITSLEVTVGSIEKWLVSVYGNGPTGFGATIMAIERLANQVNWRRSE